MKTFVINLAKDIDKREQITKECEKFNIKFELIEAVSGVDLTDDELNEKVSPHGRACLTPGEIGCALSHVLIYNKIISEGILCALILEDDAVLHDGILYILSSIEKIINPNRNHVFLLYQTDKIYANRKINLNNNLILYESRIPTYTHGYIITNKAAQTLAKINMPVSLEADAWLDFYFMKFIRAWSLNHNIITSRDSSKQASTIEKERQNLTLEQRVLRSRVRKRFSIVKIYHKIIRRAFLKQKSMH